MADESYIEANIATGERELDDSLDAVGSTTSTAAMSALANAADKMTLSDKDLEEQTSACVRACFRQRRATGVFFRVNVA